MLTGEMFIGFSRVTGQDGTINAINPATGEKLEPSYGMATSKDIERATALAAQAYDSYSGTPPEVRAQFLEKIATNIEAIKTEAVNRAHLETGLPLGRLEGEVNRTTGQLRLFASVLREGSFSGVRIDPAEPERSPIPRLDIRQRKISIGPVVVFGSSNFPFAFSNAGGDTASAFAAGSPVIVKVHNAHPGTAELISGAIIQAVKELDLPEGAYSSIIGSGNKVGIQLVTDPQVKAVGFTGSRSGGMALAQAAFERPEPIPVYAEMSSVNPVFIFESRANEAIAIEYVASLTLGSGQFCTNPGTIFVPKGELGDRFLVDVAAEIQKSTGQTMLSGNIYSSFIDGTEQLISLPGVEIVGQGNTGQTKNAPPPIVFQVDLPRFMKDPRLAQEVFGASSMAVRYSSTEELLEAAESLEGQLTATIQAEEADYPKVVALLPVLERKAGRIIANGWPTGVEVNHAMVHGGPFPATSANNSTSVGTLAIERFLRPVAYQNFPDALLPKPVQNSNPWQQIRRIDGQLEL